ncbi:flagellar basal body-associated protein FliL [Orrella sp. JC864]|uniref:flagellar basal body-associated protein FliL n=1 Tax=Orrella sp. JC864 TaxID=3120298 RepID=UPI0012BB9886
MATVKTSPAPSRGTLPSRGGSRILRPLLAIGALLLVAGASVATTWMLTSRMYETHAMQAAGAEAAPSPQNIRFVAPPAGPAQVPAPIFMPLEPFTVTLRDSDELDRILHVGLTLRLGDEQSRQRIEKYLPEVRSRLLMVLSAQSARSIQTAEGKQALARALAQAVARPFAPIPDGQTVSDVLFTAFVVQ